MFSVFWRNKSHQTPFLGILSSKALLDYAKYGLRLTRTLFFVSLFLVILFIILRLSLRLSIDLLAAHYISKPLSLSLAGFSCVIYQKNEKEKESWGAAQKAA